MMGAGKSVIGRQFAKIINYDFVDTDSLIEKKSGKKINNESLQGFGSRANRNIR